MLVPAGIEKQSKISKRGGARPGAGRKKGKLSAAKLELRELAKKHAPDMLRELVAIAKEGDSDSARVSAIKEVLDRGYGKAPQAIGGDPENPIEHVGRIEIVIRDVEG